MDSRLSHCLISNSITKLSPSTNFFNSRFRRICYSKKKLLTFNFRSTPFKTCFHLNLLIKKTIPKLILLILINKPLHYNNWYFLPISLQGSRNHKLHKLVTKTMCLTKTSCKIPVGPWMEQLKRHKRHKERWVRKRQRIWKIRSKNYSVKISTFSKDSSN